MRIVYDGPFDEVEVPDGGFVAARGEPVDAPDDVAARLLEQDTWSEALAEKPAGGKSKDGSKDPGGAAQTGGGEG
jgi:hypothetical protein